MLLPARPCRFAAAVLIALFAFAAPAQASVPHTVEPGETLWSIASASNLTNRALAAANGLPEDAQVIAGSTIYVPSVPEAAAALAGSGPVTSAPTTAPVVTTTVDSAAPPPAGAYTVQPGDTLSGIAAASGVSTGQLAWMNGIDADEPILYGTVLKLPTDSQLASAAAPAPVVPADVPNAEPYATPGRVAASDVGSIASAHGVSPSLAAAVAWQESGFNNGFVSAANARGVMQILPGTWTWVEDQLAGGPLDPSSPLDNVKAGVLYLRQLVQDSGGDEVHAVASYYQGSASVNERGLLPETEQYVQSVMSLRPRFGGP